MRAKLTMFAHLSPGLVRKLVACALGDATDVFPNEDSRMGAIGLNNKVIVERPDGCRGSPPVDCGYVRLLP